MRTKEEGRRIASLQTFVSRVAEVATHFDTDGIALRWLNTDAGLDGVMDAAEVRDVVSTHAFGGRTRLGTELWDKVLLPMLVEPAGDGTLQKPVLVVVVTDGQVGGWLPSLLGVLGLANRKKPNKEPVSKLKFSILAAQSALRKAGYGESGMNLTRCRF